MQQKKRFFLMPKYDLGGQTVILGERNMWKAESQMFIWPSLLLSSLNMWD